LKSGCGRIQERILGPAPLRELDAGPNLVPPIGIIEDYGKIEGKWTRGRNLAPPVVIIEDLK
jgi:hypothetical protein